MAKSPPASEHALGEYPGVHGLWLAGTIVALLYGSLLPFNFVLAPNGHTLLGGWSGLRAVVPGLEDALTNLVMYVPLGVIVILCGARRDTHLVRIVHAAIIGLGVSLLAEFLQLALSVRVASWFDVALNVGGCVVGSCVGLWLLPLIRSFWRGSLRHVSREPFALASFLLTLGLFFYHLAPFGFASCTAELWNVFSQVRWFGANEQVIDLAAPPFALLASRLSHAAWFTLLGYLLTTVARSRKFSAAYAAFSAASHGIVLVLLIAVMQCLSLHHNPEPPAIMLNILATVAGVWVAFFTNVFAVTAGATESAHIRIPTSVLLSAALIQVAICILRVIDPSLLGTNLPGSEALQWMPFVEAWRQPMMDALTGLGHEFLTYATLTVTLIVLAKRLQVRSGWLLAGTSAITLAFAVELLCLNAATQQADITHPLIAGLSVVLTARFMMANPALPARKGEHEKVSGRNGTAAVLGSPTRVWFRHGRGQVAP